MVILNEDNVVVENPNLELGKVINEQMLVYHSYVIEIEEQGHYEVIEKYPETGGELVDYIIDVEQSGRWVTEDKNGLLIDYYNGRIEDDWPKEQIIPELWSFQRYVLYTQEELDEIAKGKMAQESVVTQDDIILMLADMVVGG